MDAGAVHIFWDHSNLFSRARDTCEDRTGIGREPGHRYEARLNFLAMFDFARAGRTVERAVAVGSVPPDLAALWQKLGNVGLIVDLQERGAYSGKEQAVDQVLQLEMMNSIIDRDSPAVAVLLSGDGGFRPTVGRMLKQGWGVEVLSFSNGFSPKLRNLDAETGGQAKAITLDAWYRQLIYLQALTGGIIRATDPLDLSDRPRV